MMDEVTVKLENFANVLDDELEQLSVELTKLKTLGDVLSWTDSKAKDDLCPQIVSEVITQDEFSHDVIVPYKKIFLVFGAT